MLLQMMSLLQKNHFKIKATKNQQMQEEFSVLNQLFA